MDNLAIDMKNAENAITLGIGIKTKSVKDFIFKESNILALRVRELRLKDRDYVDIRQMVLSRKFNEFFPTKKGICIKIDNLKMILPYIVELCK